MTINSSLKTIDEYFDGVYDRDTYWKEYPSASDAYSALDELRQHLIEIYTLTLWGMNPQRSNEISKSELMFRLNAIRKLVEPSHG